MTTEEDNSLSLHAQVDDIAQLGPWIDGFCDRHGLPPKACFDLNLVLEELAMNSIMHGQCSSAAGAIRLTLRMEGGEVVGAVTDDGIPFDPVAVAPPDLNASLEDRKPGGLGVHLVRQLVADFAYERTGGRNRTTFRKKVE